MIDRLPHKYTEDDWVNKLRELCQIHNVAVTKTPRVILRRAFRNLKEDLDPYLMAIVLEKLVSDSDGFINIVGPTEKLLAVTVFHRAVQELGGYSSPWKAKYLRRYCATIEEDKYFGKWLELHNDASHAPLGSEAAIGDEKFVSWDYVIKLAQKSLDRASRKLIDRWDREGPLKEYQWVQANESLPSPLLQRVWGLHLRQD